MSDTCHNGDSSKLAALRERAAQMRRDAIRQRESCAARCQRLWPADRADTAYSAALGDKRLIDWVDRPAAPAIVAVVGSAGGFVPLLSVLADLPVDFAAAVIAAPHMGGSSVLPGLLRKRCRLPTVVPVAGETVYGGRIYLCPPRRHLLINADKTFDLADDEALRLPCPSADWLFQTVAATYGEYASVIVLSGLQHDGTRGVRHVKGAGGIVIVQEPRTCEYPSMPISAIGTNSVTAVLPPEQIAQALVSALSFLDLERIHRQFDSPFHTTN